MGACADDVLCLCIALKRQTAAVDERKLDLEVRMLCPRIHNKA